MAKFILSPEAQSSLKNIRTFSIKSFGTKRTKTYLQSILERFHELAENPLRGISREDLNLGHHPRHSVSHHHRHSVSHHHRYSVGHLIRRATNGTYQHDIK